MQQRSYNLIRELCKHHEVVLLAFNQRAHLESAEKLQEALEHFATFCTVLPVHSIHSDSLRFAKAVLALRSLFGRDPYTIRWLRSPAYRTAVREAAQQLRVDAVHFDTISLAQYLPAVGQLPAALNHHNIESAMLLRRAELETNPFRKFYYWQEGVRLRAYERRTAASFRTHFTCSALDADRFRQSVGEAVRTRVVPNGVDLGYFHPTGKVTKRKHSLIFAGRMSWYPNAAAMQFMVRSVWPLLKVRCPAVFLTVVGKSPSSELLEAAARDDHLEVTGFVDDVRPYIEGAEVYVCPIFDGGGTKLKILDALAMECAIVAHPVACEGIDVTDGVNVLFATTAQDFADCVQRLFDDAALRGTLSSAARRLAAETYSFTSIGEVLARCYDELRPDLGLTERPAA